jgi:CubicO group peptidase (beta-lactamase class C family)
MMSSHALSAFAAIAAVLLAPPEVLDAAQESPLPRADQSAWDIKDPTGEAAWLADGLTAAQRDDIRAAFRWGIRRRFIPGGALLIVHRGKVVFREAFGVADLETGRPFTVDAPCRIASVTKPHTATLMAMLVEDGKLAWDDPVDKYLPRFSGVKVRGKGPAARQPKIRELLSHTAGFPANKEPESNARKVKTGNKTLADAADQLAADGLATEPGSVFAYTGSGYIVAGRIAEIVTGREFNVLMKERLLDPIGATTAVFYPFASKELKARMPTMYQRQEGRLVKRDDSSRGEGAMPFPSPGGGLISTLDDVGRLLLLHRNRGMVGAGRRIAPESLRALYQPQRATGPEGYGLGFNVLRTGADGVGDRVRHIGASGTLVLMDFKRDLLLVMLTQVPQTQTLPFRAQVLKAVGSVFSLR